MSIANNLTLSDILGELIASAGISEAELARKIKIPTATLNKLKTGSIEDPRTSTLTIIAKYFGLTIEQLLGHAPIAKTFAKTYVHVPILDYKNIPNTDISTLNFANHHSWVSVNITNEIHKAKLFAIRTYGSAMAPYFDKNTIAIIDCEHPIDNQQYILAYIEKSKEIILRQILIDGDTKILKPTNSSFDSIKLTTHDTILGVVIYSMKEYV